MTSNEFQPEMAALTTALDEVLDVAAGLADAELPASHHTLTTDLDAVLDVEAGLAEVQPPTATEPSALHRFAKYVEALPPVERLARRAPVSKELGELRATSTAILALDITHQLREFMSDLEIDDPMVIAEAARQLREDIDRRREELGNLDTPITNNALRTLTQLSTSTLDRQAIGQFLTDLSELLSWTNQWRHRMFMAAMAAARPGTEMFTALRNDMVLDEETDLGDTRAFHQSLIDAVNILEVVMTDFVGADLRDADLSDVTLGGLRWSSATRWPPEWVAEIRTRSTEIGPDLFEVGPDTQISSPDPASAGR